MKLKHFIDSHKGVTAFYILGLMAFFGTWDNVTAWIYLALHGTYGFLWVCKSRIFPDKSWERTVSVSTGLLIWLALSLYWIAPFLITSRNSEAPPWLLGICVSIYALGVFLHFTSDMQKYMQLKLQPQLIHDGLWRRIRNPNYLGELLIYLGFSILAVHWLPLVSLAGFILILWIPNMRRKDKSLSRYPGFEEYKKDSWGFIPFLY